MGFRYADSCGHLVGDIIPYYDEESKQYHIFYLRGHPEGTGLARFDTPWAHCVTRDWRTVEVLPDALTKGLRGDCDDGACFTGCVVRHQGIYYLFYTAFSPYGDKSREVISLATSGDGVHFSKYEQNPLLVPDYTVYGASDDFRDPYVWFDQSQGCWRMLFAAGLVAERCLTRRGAIGQAKSPDLLHWTLGEPFYAPRIYPSLECPDLFRIGEWYYLLFSQFGRTEYRMSRTPDGPWQMPKKPCFDCGEYFFYAAKTLFDGKRRLLLGWCGQLRDGKDAHSALWGGLVVSPREVKALPDGELYLDCPEELKIQTSPGQFSLQDVFSDQKMNGPSFTLGRPDGFDAAVLSDSDCGEYRLSVRVSMPGDRGVCGVVLRTNERLGHCYMLEINRSNNMMYFKRYDSYHLFSGDTVNMDIVLAEKRVSLSEAVFEIHIHFEKNVMEAFVGRSVMTVPVAELTYGQAGFFAAYGEATFDQIRFEREDLPANKEK